MADGWGLMILKILLGAVAVVVGLIVLAIWNVKRATRKRDAAVARLLEPVLERLSRGEDGADEAARELVMAPETRNEAILKLKEMGRQELIPEEMTSVERMAEGMMANWLMHGNELGVAPAEVETVETFEVEHAGANALVMLLKFRAPAGHWAEEDGWMAGIAGPFWKDGQARDVPQVTFSELRPFAAMSAEEHLEDLKKALKGGLVVRG